MASTIPGPQWDGSLLSSCALERPALVFWPCPSPQNRRDACSEPGSPRNFLFNQPGPAARACAGLVFVFILSELDPAVIWLKREPGYCLGRWRSEPEHAGLRAQCACEACLGVRRSGRWAVGWGLLFFQDYILLQSSEDSKNSKLEFGFLVCFDVMFNYVGIWNIFDLTIY